ncbi:branched-chain amino acid ABC transporter permease [Notoacmeibacter marinus]|uniref:Branched-chain amino acid ABC transporter permease n=1 Tax=Notoacmeibacter marinus TaxID=1876515 RepID=A0A231UWW3_9HYPH|nr:AzlC family ABC transporter permease [Notoacmeibacter marinus]OXT00390.1 branched-chain amino acid ABC transporter permease [Notoacmeibacter marinus]
MTAPPLSPAAGFVAGIVRSLPICAAIAPFGLLYGALAADTGLSVFEATFMSATIFGGASQMVGLQLFDGRVPGWLIVLSIFAVNFRHILYSAALGPKIMHWRPWQRLVGWFVLSDPQFAESMKMADKRPVAFSWYFGLGLTIYGLWVLESYLGARFGALIEDPEALGLDFMLPLYFFGMLYDFRSRKPFFPIVGASAAGSVLAMLTVGSPWHVSIGAICGIATAILIGAPEAPPPMPPEAKERTT